MKSTIYTLLFLLLGFTGCNSHEDRSTNTVSTSFKSDAEKIAFMEKYYSPDFVFEDVEFHIVYWDNGSGFGAPGPSDWTMRFAFKLDKAAIEKLKKSEESRPFSIDNWTRFLPKNKKWSVDYPKKYFSNGNVLIEENGILLIDESTNS